ncbi:hypothetical protein CPB83DRAFT_842538, partial [Crepidotus variabilis]
MASNAEKQPVPNRGRNVASKPLREGTTMTETPGHAAPTASSKFRTIPSSASSTSVMSGGSKAARTPSASSVASSKSSIRSSSSASKIAGTKASARTPSESDQIRVTKVSTTTVKISSSSWTPPAPPSKEPPKAPAPAPASKEVPSTQQAKSDDPLQIAAQVYPWTYMSTTLDACFKTAEDSANKELETRTKELETRESAVADQKERAEAEQAIEFYDELESDVFAKNAPAIMQLFQSHGESCDKIEGEALKLANRLGPDLDEEEPLKPYTEMLDRLEELQTTAAKLQESIIILTEKANAPTDGTSNPALIPSANGPENEAEPNSQNPEAAIDSEPSARTQISTVFSACLPVIKARIANLSMAQELMDMALENASLTLRMESMGIA